MTVLRASGWRFGPASKGAGTEEASVVFSSRDGCDKRRGGCDKRIDRLNEQHSNGQHESRQNGPRRPTVMRFAGAGIELAGACLAGGLLGYVVDRFVLQGDEQWGFLVGGLLGFAIGMTNLIRLAMKFNQ